MATEKADEIRKTMPHELGTLREWWAWKCEFGAPNYVVGSVIARGCTLIRTVFDKNDIKGNIGAAKVTIYQDGFSLINDKGRSVSVEIDKEDISCYNVRISSSGDNFYCENEREVNAILVSFFRLKAAP